MAARWVIVAQMRPEAHCPDVYGTWETREAAQEQLERWQRRIERTLGVDEDGSFDGVHISVEPMRSKTAAQFEEDFHYRTGWPLQR